MFQSVRRAVVQGVEKTWHTLASHTGEGKGEQLWDKESNLFKRDILMNGQLLGENIDVEVRIEAIRKIGILAYTGETKFIQRIQKVFSLNKVDQNGGRG